MEVYTIYKKQWIKDIKYQGETHPVYSPLEPYLKCSTEQEAKDYIKFFYDSKWKFRDGESFTINKHHSITGHEEFGAFNGRDNIKL